jgi:hypothetical protein
MAKLWFTMASCPGVLSLATPKLAAIALLVRIFEPSDVHRRVLWTMGWTCFINLLLVNVLVWVQCNPPRATFDVSITDAQCWNPWVYTSYCIYASGTFLASLPSEMHLETKPLILGSLFCIPRSLPRCLSSNSVVQPTDELHEAVGFDYGSRLRICVSERHQYRNASFSISNADRHEALVQSPFTRFLDFQISPQQTSLVCIRYDIRDLKLTSGR